MGQQTAEVLQTAVASAASKSSGIVATMIGIITLIVTASGVFVEMQTALNVIWKATPKGTTVSQLIRARAASKMVANRSPTVRLLPWPFNVAYPSRLHRTLPSILPLSTRRAVPAGFMKSSTTAFA
jgi:hypothetical protein